MNWRETGDITLDQWMTLLTKMSSPIIREARETYAAMKGLSALGTAMAIHESQLATAFRLNSPQNMNPFNLKFKGLGSFMKFNSYAEAFASWKERITDPNYKYANAITVADLVHIYAPSSDNNDERAYVTFIEDFIRQVSQTSKEAVVTRPTRVILNMGHRDLTGGGTAGGNLTEKGYTDDIVLACETLLKKAGVEVFVNQRYDGDPDDTMLNNNLDWVGRTAVSINNKFGPVDAYLSIHLEGSQAPGVFAIVPDSAGLLSFTTGKPDPGDTWSDNPKDVQFARALAKYCSSSTGLSKRLTTEPGVMSERATGVGGSGWRLSEFHETVPMRETATRNILECGALPNASDRAIISRSDFPTKIAQGVVAAVQEVFKPAVITPPTPTPPVKDVFSDVMWERLWGSVRPYKKTGRIESTWRLWCKSTGMYPAFLGSMDRREGGQDYLFVNGLIIRFDGSTVFVLKGV